MRGVNKVILVGTIGQDPAVNNLPNGSQIANFSMATSEVWKDKQSGQNQERTEWHQCTAFGSLAGIIAQYACKGMKVYIEGKLKTTSWEDQSGTKKYKTGIDVKEFQMLSKNKNQAPQQEYQQPQQQPNGYDNFEDDIPF